MENVSASFDQIGHGAGAGDGEVLGGELAGLGMAQEYVCHGEKSLKIRVHIRAKNNAGRALSLSHMLSEISQINCSLSRMLSEISQINCSLSHMLSEISQINCNDYKLCL